MPEQSRGALSGSWLARDIQCPVSALHSSSKMDIKILSAYVSPSIIASLKMPSRWKPALKYVFSALGLNENTSSSKRCSFIFSNAKSRVAFVAQVPMPFPRSVVWKRQMRKLAQRRSQSISLITLSPIIFPSGAIIKKKRLSFSSRDLRKKEVTSSFVNSSLQPVSRATSLSRGQKFCSAHSNLLHPLLLPAVSKIPLFYLLYSRSFWITFPFGVLKSIT